MHQHHRSLKAWIEAKEVSKSAYRAARHHWTPDAAAMFAQLQRSALSIQLNIAEGFALADLGRFGNHLAVAYGSAVETGDLLELMLEEGILPENWRPQCCNAAGRARGFSWGCSSVIGRFPGQDEGRLPLTVDR